MMVSKDPAHGIKYLIRFSGAAHEFELDGPKSDPLGSEGRIDGDHISVRHHQRPIHERRAA